MAYPGAVPRWTEVPAERLSNPPYSLICEIKGISNGTPRTSGTGWLSSRGFVVTAAHLLHNADRCAIRWASSTIWHETDQFTLHPDYIAGNGDRLTGSAADIAKITMETGLPEGGLSTTAAVNSVAAIGIAANRLVEHSGVTALVSPFLGHECDTESGHSGCPILANGALVGMHVGPATLSRQYLRASQRPRLSTLNSAVYLGGGTIGFLLG